MNAAWRFLRGSESRCLVIVIGLGLWLWATAEGSESCVLPSAHAGLTFPVERIDTGWACRLQPIVNLYTTATKVGPVRTALSETLYMYLLDRPPTAAKLIRRLDLGLYRSEARGPGRFWGNDGEGTEGVVELVYQDRTSRMYYVEGSHASRLLPDVTGKAVVLLRMVAVTEPNGAEAVETTLVAYTRLDNRILSGLVSLLRPLIGGTVTRKLGKGVETVNRLGLMIRQQPDRVMAAATDPPALPADDLAFVKAAVTERPHSQAFSRPNATSP